MTSKNLKGIDDMEMDTRLIEHRLRSGKLDRKEYEAYLKKLPDDEARGEYIAFEEVEERTPLADQLTFTSG